MTKQHLLSKNHTNVHQIIFIMPNFLNFWQAHNQIVEAWQEALLDSTLWYWEGIISIYNLSNSNQGLPREWTLLKPDWPR